MKKIIQLISESTGLPLVGRTIALIRTTPADGLEVDLSEIGNGAYKAASITAGIYEVFDKTGGGAGVDLGEVVDVISSTLSTGAEPTLPTSGSGWLAKGSGPGGRAWSAPGIADVTGLTANLDAKDTAIGGKQSTLAVTAATDFLRGDLTRGPLTNEDIAGLTFPASKSLNATAASITPTGVKFRAAASGATDLPILPPPPFKLEKISGASFLFSFYMPTSQTIDSGSRGTQYIGLLFDISGIASPSSDLIDFMAVMNLASNMAIIPAHYWAASSANDKNMLMRFVRTSATSFSLTTIATSQDLYPDASGHLVCAGIVDFNG